MKPNINDARHPSRQKAIHILEAIAEKIGQPDIFDCNEKNNTLWYELEDMVTYMIEGTRF